MEKNNQRKLSRIFKFPVIRATRKIWDIEKECYNLTMDQEIQKEIQKKLAEQEVKLEAIYRSVEKTRKYFLVIIWVTIIGLVVPMIGLAFVIPSFLSNYGSALNSFD